MTSSSRGEIFPNQLNRRHQTGEMIMTAIATTEAIVIEEVDIVQMLKEGIEAVQEIIVGGAEAAGTAIRPWCSSVLICNIPFSSSLIVIG